MAANHPLITPGPEMKGKLPGIGNISTNQLSLVARSSNLKTDFIQTLNQTLKQVAPPKQEPESRQRAEAQKTPVEDRSKTEQDSVREREESWESRGTERKEETTSRRDDERRVKNDRPEERKADKNDRKEKSEKKDPVDDEAKGAMEAQAESAPEEGQLAQILLSRPEMEGGALKKAAVKGEGKEKTQTTELKAESQRLAGKQSETLPAEELIKDIFAEDLKNLKKGKKGEGKKTAALEGKDLGDEKKSVQGKDVKTVALDPEKWSVYREPGADETKDDSKKELNLRSKDAGRRSAKQSVETVAEKSSNGGVKSEGGDSNRPGFDMNGMRKENQTEIKTAQNRETQTRDNRAKFNDMIDRARMNLGGNGRSSASIRMNPGNLGRMTLNLQLNQNNLQARLVVESEAAKKMLMDDMDFLRQELRQNGIQVESFSIKVREPSQVYEQNMGKDKDGENKANLDGGKDGQESRETDDDSELNRFLSTEDPELIYEANMSGESRRNLEGRVNLSV